MQITFLNSPRPDFLLLREETTSFDVDANIGAKTVILATFASNRLAQGHALQIALFDQIKIDVEGFAFDVLEQRKHRFPHVYLFDCGVIRDTTDAFLHDDPFES